MCSNNNTIYKKRNNRDCEIPGNSKQIHKVTTISQSELKNKVQEGDSIYELISLSAFAAIIKSFSERPFIACVQSSTSTLL